jgi:hypothetical protein
MNKEAPMKDGTCKLPKGFVKEEAAEGHPDMKRLAKKMGARSKAPRNTGRSGKR